jgi:hypothetical protein
MKRSTITAALLILSSAAFAATGARDVFTYNLVLFMHQLLFVFWLGPDIGVYMWSTKATNPELSPAQRVSAGRIMRSIEIIPQVCMSLMLTVGGILTELMGIEHPWWQMVGIWLLGPVWLTLTLLVYLNKGAGLLKFDLLFRAVVILTVLLSVAYSTITERLADVPWLTAKILLFAAAVFFGLMMRQRLAPFGADIDTLEAAGPSPELDRSMQTSVARARIFMFATWIALAMAAGLGMAQPGSPEAAVEVIVVEPGEQIDLMLPE